MSKKLPTNGFKWIDNNETAEPSAKHVINEDFIKNYNENNDKGYILEVDVKYYNQRDYMNYTVIYLLVRTNGSK